MLYVGRLVESKGIIDLLKVAKISKSSNIRKLRSWFVGNGPLKYLIKYYEKPLLVKYLGYIEDRRQLAKVYRNSDILVLPSKKTKTGKNYLV